MTVFFLLTAWSVQAREILISGNTMGTTYHIKVVTGAQDDVAALEEHITRRLVEVNHSMSTYQPDSEISRFNRLETAQEAFAVSADFLQVMTVARRLYHLTGGAWDGTVYPLVAMWGFTTGKPPAHIPSPQQIREILPRTGFDKISISTQGWLSKTIPEVTLDLASIAKGFGVDQVAAVLRQAGFDNYLVEIGGEVYAAGRRPDGKQWRIGINRPVVDAPQDAVYQVVELQDEGFATSGNYRNFFERDGVRYSHIIDPRNGCPVTNGVASVSIVAETCTVADGLATAIMVMGPEAGIDLLDRLQKVEGLVVVEQPDGSLKDYVSRGFRSQVP